MARAVLRRIPLIAAFLALLIATPALAADPPGAVSGSATAVGQTTATLRGSVNPRGQATQYWFEYGQTNAFGARTATVDGGNGDGNFDVDAQIGSLKPGTTYRYRLVARNATGTTQGSTRSFRTDNAPLIATTGGARDQTQTTATVTATLNNRGQDASYVFEYGPTGSYGAASPATAFPANGSSQGVTAGLTGLTADTTYHYRVVMTIGSTVTRGSDKTFKTSPIPNGLLLQSSANPVSYGGSTDLYGVLAGSSNSGKTITVQADTYPFDGNWTTIASGRTDSTGAYRITISPLLTSSQLRTIASTSPAVTSQPITVGVKLQATLHVGTTRTKRGSLVRFSGSVTPDTAGAPISIQIKRNGSWVTVAHTSTGSGSSYSRRVRLWRSGSYRTVARPTNGSHVLTTTSSRYIRVGR
jgi:hypothetical protein